MTNPILRIHQLSKVFRVPEREAGLRAAAKSLFSPTYREVSAVQNLTFSLQPGEVMGLIGPNGAGKTTTLKMLAGLLHPSSGEAELAGYIPWERKADFLRKISMVQGNKSQLIWDIPALDTFKVLAEIYNVPPVEYQRSLDELVTLLDMNDLLTRPVRNLSLGERMKCELAAGLLHRPGILFLDEPTLGLDVSMQVRLRSFLVEYNRRSGASILLTSHYMADVEALCSRVVLLHQGKILYDGELQKLALRMAPFKLIRLTLDGSLPDAAPLPDLPPGMTLLERSEHILTLRAPRQSAPNVTAHLLGNFPINDLSVEDPPIEAVIDQIYQEGEV